MGALWIAESQGLLNIETDRATVRFEIPHSAGITAVATNDVNGDVWALGHHGLHGFSRKGDPLASAPLPSGLDDDDDDRVGQFELSADGVAGNLWLSTQRLLHRFDFQGTLRQTLKLPSSIVALSLDRTRAQLWVALARELHVHDADGRRLLAVPMAGPTGNTGPDEDDDESDDDEDGPQIRDLAYDLHHDAVWVVLNDRLRRYSATGRLAFELAGKFQGPMAPDGSGGLWLARGRVLSHVSDTGAENVRIEPFSTKADQHKNIVDLVADPGDASIWVASQRRIKHYAIDGALLHDLTPNLSDGVIRKLRRAALYADLDPPEITITAPAHGSLLNNNRPTFELRYFDLGVGVAPDTIKITVDGQPLAVSCSAKPSNASCTPNSALPEGELQISATVADFAGNVSNPDEIGITIDTTPPEITLTHPAQDHITNQPALTIRGSLNEPGTLTVNNSAVSLSSSFGFTHNTQLAEGGNAFELAATDRAGNRSNKTLRVILDTVPPAIPVSGLVTVGESENGQAIVIGQPGSVEALARITITNQRTGETVSVFAGTDGSFAVSIRAEAGDAISLYASDRASNASGPITLQIPGGFDFRVAEPVDGAFVPGDSILVTGYLKAPPNTGVTVNGVAAEILVQTSGTRFYVQVPLNLGQNQLEVTAHLPSGRTLSKSLTVTSQDFLPFEATATPQQGVAPVDVSFSVTGHSISKISIDFDGDGTFDVTVGGDQREIVRTYTAPGAYLAQIRVQEQSGSSQVVVPIIVHDRVQLDQTLRGVWNGLNSALISGDRDKAVQAFSLGSRGLYAQIFQQLSPNLATILAEFSGIQPVGISHNIADYAVLTVHNNKTSVHIVNFIRGQDGVWRIDSM